MRRVIDTRKYGRIAVESMPMKHVVKVDVLESASMSLPALLLGRYYALRTHACTS